MWIVHTMDKRQTGEQFAKANNVAIPEGQPSDLVHDETMTRDNLPMTFEWFDTASHPE